MTNQKRDITRLLHDAAREVELIVGRNNIHLSHLEKILWPKKKITKKDLAIYYIKNSDWILPELKDRPITVFRCIEGVMGECFYQRHFDEKLPKFIKTADIWTEDKKSDQQYICINNLATLLWLVNREVIEVHTWLSKIRGIRRIRGIRSRENLEKSNLNFPDCIVFDLDPHIAVETLRGASLRSVAMLLKSELENRKMTNWIKTTGLGGLHIIAAIRRNRSFEQTRQIAKEIAEKLSSENPKLITDSYREEDKEDKVLIDYSQNAIGKSIVALGSPRSDSNASISSKIGWKDVESGNFKSNIL